VHLKFALPPGAQPLSTVFEQVEAARREFPIDDFGVSQTSLEQVFVRFAQQPAALPPSLLRLAGSPRDESPAGVLASRWH
jgi:hypothetical protein